MIEYHKIQTIFKRDIRGQIVEGDYTLPVFEYLKDNKWAFTEKVDGTNTRVLWDGSNVQFGGRTANAQMPVFLLKVLQSTFLPEILREVFPDGTFTLFGEGYGARIQKGGGNYKSNGVDFVLFDVLATNSDGHSIWLERPSLYDIAEKLGIGVVPVVGYGTLADAVELVRAGQKSVWGNFTAEGLVLRPYTELMTRNGHRVIAKIKHRDFTRNPR